MHCDSWLRGRRCHAVTERSQMFRFAQHDGSPLSRYATALPKGEPRSERQECGAGRMHSGKNLTRCHFYLF